MHLIYNNRLKDHALLEATSDAALHSKSTNSQVSAWKLRDWGLQSSIYVTSRKPTLPDSTSNTACSANLKFHHNLYILNSGLQKTQTLPQGMLCYNYQNPWVKFFPMTQKIPLSSSNRETEGRLWS